MAIDDNTSYELTGAQVKDLASKINAKADSANLATVATSGSYNDLSNKPTIPAAQVNSDWDAASGVAQILNKPSLATVATSGSYADLSNKPTIPTVNNATLTIQKNGTAVETFTANSSSNKTANITVPTKVSDITSDVGGNTFIGTSDTAVGTAAKVVTVSADQNFVLAKGVMITFKAPGTNTAENPTIEVNGTGAKSIWFNTAVVTTGNLNKAGQNGRYATYVYDGTYWVWVSWGADDNTTYSNMSVSEGTTGTATSQRTMRADYLKQIIDYHIRTADNLTPTADTTAAWKTALGSVNGHYYTWYSSASKFTNQPSQYGFLETFIQGSDIYQRWHTQASGPILYRSGNSSGWSNPSDGTWNTVATTANIGDATLTIQKNSTTVDTFTANATSNKTVNIEVPTAVSELTNDAGYITDADIPTVNDATLTIQKNGTTVTTFTANSSTNKTANITATDVTVTNTDPGEGSALAANTLLGVYDIAPEDVDGSRLTDGTVTREKINWGTIRKTLYQGASESTAVSTVTLSSAPSGFDKLEIWIANSDGDRIIITIAPNATRFSATAVGGLSGTIYFHATIWTISGSTITWGRSYMKTGTSANWTSGTNQDLWVYKVVGIKY